jgi:tetratricopeptide (TPR) repeat protein
MHPRPWLAILLTFAVCLPASAQDDWAGKRVILKRPGIRIGHTDDKGNQVYVDELTNLAYTVLKETNGFLRVQHRGKTGWFPKTDALLPDEAIPYFAERVRLANPKDAFPLAYLGWAHKERKNLDLAIEAYDNAIKRDPRHDWFNNRGLLYLEAGKYDRAIADFTQAVKLAPKFVMAIENRASAYGAAGKNLMALDDWNEVLRQEPANGAALLRRARVYIEQKEPAKALADLNAILKIDPNNVPAFAERGHLHVDMSQIDKALADFTQAIRLDKTNVQHYLDRSQLYTEKKEYAKALADAEEALRLVPASVDARLARGGNLFLTGDFAKASADFAKAVDLHPDHAAAYNSQAWFWATCPDEKFRDGKKALAYADKAWKLADGKEPAILDTKAAALAETGDFAQAVQVQERAIRELAGTELLQEARARLELYKKKAPYRQKIGK